MIETDAASDERSGGQSVAFWRERIETSEGSRYATDKRALPPFSSGLKPDLRIASYRRGRSALSEERD